MIAETSECSVWLDFGIQALAGLIAGAILLFASYWFIERRFHLRERHDQAEREQQSRRDMREQVLSHVLEELKSNAAKLPDWKDALSAEDFGVPYPGFDVTGWSLIGQTPALIALKKATISALSRTYNRMQSANEQLAAVAELDHGPTAILTSSLAAPRIDEHPRVKEIYAKFEDLRDRKRKMLVERLDELKPHIDGAIDAVEEELGITTVPAAQRRFVTD
jgi:hypothetical protein